MHKTVYRFLSSPALAALVVSAVGLVARADHQWTGGSTESVKYWDDEANWTGDGVDNWVVNTAQTGGTPVTITFRGTELHEITTGFWIENGFDGPVTFTADSLASGFTMTGEGGYWYRDMHLGGQQAADLTIDGGTYHFANDLLVGNSADAKFTLTSGRVETAYWMPIGVGAATTSDILVEGGELIVGYRNGLADNGRLELGRNAGSTVNFRQTDGQVSACGGSSAGDEAISIGWGANTTATYTLEGGTLTARGYFTKLANGSGSTATLNLYGGVIEPVILNTGAGTAVIDWNGGTIRATERQNILPASDNLTVTLGEKGGTLDTTTMDTTISAALLGSGDLTKVGTAPLTLASDLANYTGTVIVERGALRLDETIALKKVTVKSGAVVFISGDNAAACTSVDELKALVGGADAVWTVEDGGRIVGYGATRTDTETPVVTEWIGGNYTDASSWTLGVPTAIDTARFASDAVVRMNFNGASAVMATLDIQNGAHVVFGPDSEANYPGLRPGTVTGTGTLECRRSGFDVSTALTIPETIDLVFSNSGTISGNDAWLQGNDVGITVEGDVTVKNYLVLYRNVTVNGKVTIADGARLQCMKNAGTRNLGEVSVNEGETGTIDGRTLASDLVKTGAGTLNHDVEWYDNLVIKEGTVNLASNCGPSQTFSFAGGTLRFQYAMGWFDELMNRINNGTHTAAIKLDSAGQDITFNTVVGGTTTTYGFVKKGEGSITLAVQPTYTGNTTIEAGTLILPLGVAISGTLDIADGADISFAVDPLTWTVGYSQELFTVGALAEGLELTLGENVSLSGLSEAVGATFTLSTNEDGKVVVTATVTGTELVWNGANGADWRAENAWTNKKTDESVTYENAADVFFTGAELPAGPMTNTVTVAADVTVGAMNGTAGIDQAYRFTGEAIEASNLLQSGEGALVFANKGVRAAGVANISAGEVILEGAALEATNVFTIAESASVRVTGETESVVTGTATGAGSYVIDEGATLTLATEQATGVKFHGTGTLNPTNGAFRLTTLDAMSNFGGTLRIGPTARLSMQAGANDKEHYELGQNSTILLEGGEITRFAMYKGTDGGGNNVWIGGTLVIADGTENTLRNLECRQHAGRGANLRIPADITGGGKATFYSSRNNTAWFTDFQGDNSNFTGEMTLIGYTYKFASAQAGSPNGTWNLASTDSFEFGHAANTTIAFGSLNSVVGSTMNVWNEGANFKIGAKADSTLNGTISGQATTVTKVGAQTSLFVNGEASTATLVVSEGAAGGTGTVAGVEFADGAEVAFADLSDTTQEYAGLTSLTRPVYSKKPAVKQEANSKGHWATVVKKGATEDGTETWTLTAVFRKNSLCIIVR